MKTIKTIFTLLTLTGLTINLHAQEKSPTPLKKETTATQQTVKTQPAAQAKAMKPMEANPFAGNTFNIILKERAKTEAGDKDLLTFDHVNFESMGCRQYGFTPSSYKYVFTNNIPTFEVNTTSPKEGKMLWKGILKGDKLSGMAVWTKEGQEPIQYTFTGGVVPKVTKEEPADKE